MNKIAYQVSDTCISLKSNYSAGDLGESEASALLEEFRDKSWNSFNRYASFQENNRVIRRDDTREIKYSCNCSENIKTFICHHALGFAMHMNVHTPPSTQELHRPKSSGRPQTVTSEWQRRQFALGDYISASTVE